MLVGHGLHHDLGLLLKRGRNIYSHPNRQLRDLEVLCAAGGVTPGVSSDFCIFSKVQCCGSTFISVADPGCLSGSRIRIFSVQDPNFFHPGSRIHIKEFRYFNPKKLFLSSWKYDPGCSSRIRILIFTYPRSRIQGSKRSRIRIRNTDLLFIQEPGPGFLVNPDPDSLFRFIYSWASLTDR